MERVLPILFNTDMVRAILDGRKTVTRRCVKFLNGKNPNWTGYVIDGLMLYNGINEPCIKPCQYHPGDTLYVRETWSEVETVDGVPFYIYKADHSAIYADANHGFDKWHPSIHMPKEAARIFIKVKDVRVERLQEITEGQAKEEGAIDNRGFIHSPDNEYDVIHTAKEHFKQIWDSTIEKSELDRYGWNASPWVWVIEFERCEKTENM